MVTLAPKRRAPVVRRRPAPPAPASPTPSLPRPSRRADGFAVGLLLGLTALVAWNRLGVDLWLSRHDLLTFFLPWYAFLGEQLRAGNVPGWNPHLFAGTPFAADPESGWMYLPAMLFFPFLSALTAFEAMVVLQLLVAALSTYAFARVLGLGPVAGLVAAVVFAFGPFLHHNTYCCTVRAQLAGWIPLALLGVELALRAAGWWRRLVPWFVGGFAISQMFAGWLGQGTVNGLLLVAAYLGYRVLLSPPVAGRPLRGRLGGGVATGLAVVGLGLALGAAGVLPRLDVSRDTLLGGGDYEALGQPHAATPYSPARLLAHLLGDGPLHRAVALGGATLVLAPLAPFVARGRFAVPFFAGMTLVVYALTQETTPLHRLFYLIPRFRSLHEHSPHQINAVVMIGPAILSAAAVEALPRWRGRRDRLPVVAVPFVLVGVAWLALSWAGMGVGWPPLAAAAVVAALIAIAVADPRSPGPRWNPGRLVGLVPALILAVAFVQPTGQEIVESALGRPLDPTWAEFWRPNPVLEAAIATNVARVDPGGAGEFLQARRDAAVWPLRQVGYGGIEHPAVWPPPPSYQDRRTEPTIQALLVNGRPIFLGLREIQGYNPTQLRRYSELVSALNGRPQNYHVANLLPDGVRSPLLNLLGVRYLLVDATLPPERGDVALLAAGRQAVFRTAEVVVYENANALPGAWIVHDVRSVAPGGALAPLASGEVDPRQTALVEGAPPVVARPVDPAADAARVTRFAPDAIEVATETTAPGLLVVNEVYDRGWRATVDGAPAEILPTNHVQRGIPLPAGTHRVELRYDPPALRLGLWISGVAWAAMLAVFGAAAWARTGRRRGRGRGF